MTESPQAALMRKSRTSSSFDPYELTCLLWGGQDPKYPFHTSTADYGFSECIVQERRAAFERVEKTLGTHDTSKLPRCYSQTSREDLFEQGLEMGKACLDEKFEHGHEHFVWITPRYNLTNAR
jgi:acyl-CoA oxidase